jgi:hypothetical protein
METPDSARVDARRFMMVAALAVIVGLVAPTGVNAAGSSKVTVKNPFLVTRVQDSTGDPVEAESIPPGGSTSVPGSDGALATKNYSGGSGFIGVIDCDTGTAAKASTITVAPDSAGNEVVEAIIMGTDDSADTGTFKLTAGGPLAALGDILYLTVSPDNPNDSVALPYGLAVSSVPVTLTCTTTGAGNSASAVLIGR